MLLTATLVADQTHGTDFAAACGAGGAAACAPVAPAHGIEPCGFLATASAFLLAEGVDLAHLGAPERAALVLARAAQLMRDVASARRAYVAAHAGEFCDEKAGDNFVAAWCGQWDVAALVASAGAPRAAFLRIVRRAPAAPAAAPAPWWQFTKQEEAQTAAEPLAVVRRWFAEEAPFWAAGDAFFVQEGASMMRVCEWLARHRGAPLPPLIVDGVGHFWAAQWRAERDHGGGGAPAVAAHIFDSLPGRGAEPDDVTAAFAAALAAALVAAEAGGGVGSEGSGVTA